MIRRLFRRGVVLGGFLFLPVGVRGQEPTFEYGAVVPSVACGGQILGREGAAYADTADLTLTTSDAPDPARGAQGWSLSMAVEGIAVTAATTEGTVAAAEPVGLRLGVSFELTEVTAGPGNEGVVSAVVLALIEDVVLPGEGTQVICKADLEGSFPPEGPPNPDDPPVCGDPIRLVYRSGLVGSGQPVDNNITWEGATVIPVLGECTFQLCVPGAIPEECTNGVDDNEDGLVDCDDPLCQGGPDCGGCADAPVNYAFQAAPVVGPGNLNQVPDLPLGVLDGSAPTEIPIGPGGTATAYGAIVSQLGAEGVGGVQGWSTAIAVDGDVTPISATTEGTIAAGEPGGLRKGVSFELTEVIDPANNAGQKGAVSAVVLALIEDVFLDADGTATVLAIQLEAPDQPEFTGGLRCQDDLRGSGQPVQNLLTVAGESRRSCNCFPARMVVARDQPFRRGDPNDDGKNNLADAVWIVNELFRGGPPTTCPEAADANDDGMEDLSDAVYVVNYQFMEGAPPPAPFPDCGIVEGADCPFGSYASCP